jgi:hypothetical protein
VSELDPLVPAEVDLRGYDFMPLYGDRLFSSETWVAASADAKVAALRLWWHAYAREVPAASLPDNDVLLSEYAGYGIAIKTWQKVRPAAMRGWNRCSDGRLYHKELAKWALEAWDKRVKDRKRKADFRAARMRTERGQDADRTRTRGGTERGQDGSGTVDSEATVKRSEATVILDSKATTKSKTVALAASRPLKPLTEERRENARAVWQAYSDAYVIRYGEPPVRNAKTNGIVVLLLDRLPTAEAPGVAGHFVRSQNAYYVGRGHSLDLLLADAEKLRTEWATNRHGTNSEARMADKTQARGNVFEEARRELKNAS